MYFVFHNNVTGIEIKPKFGVKYQTYFNQFSNSAFLDDRRR